MKILFHYPRDLQFLPCNVTILKTFPKLFPPKLSLLNAPPPPTPPKKNGQEKRKKRGRKKTQGKCRDSKFLFLRTPEL